MAAKSGFGVFAPGNFGRIDQGVDFVGQGGIPALDSGVVTDVGTAHIIEGGTYPYVVYQLKAGPYRGRYVYVAENFTPLVHVGTTVKQGDLIGYAHGTSPYIEVGFNQTAKGWTAYGSPSDRNSPQGTKMWKYIQGLIGVAKAENPNAGSVAGGVPVVGGVVSGVGDVVSGISSFADAIKFLFSTRGLQTIGGGILVLMGLYLLTKQIGLGVDVPGPIKTAANAAVPESRILTRAHRQGQREGRVQAARREGRAEGRRSVAEQKPIPRKTRRVALEGDTRPRREVTYDPSTSEIPF